MTESTTSERIVLRVGEIFLKGRNRRMFYGAFVRNARQLLSDLRGVRVEAAHLRAIVHHQPGQSRACIERLSRLFGLSSMSPAVPAERDLDAIAEVAIARARTFDPAASFKVETNRRDKTFPIRSPEVSRDIGARIVAATGLRVDVQRPDRMVQLDISEEGCFVFDQVVPGPGGLPVGVSGDVAVLLSGGIDSPVAAWSAMRRGCKVQAIYFHSFPYTGDKTKEKVIELARLLAAWQGGMKLWVVHFTEVQKALREAVDGELAVIAYRRMMMRVAGLIARREHCRALITGENLGQVASQTLENLAAIEAASPLPVLRPLITYDKHEIILQAQRIGTYETSILPYDDCCALFVPKHPVTRTHADVMDRRERSLDVSAMAQSLADAAESIAVG